MLAGRGLFEATLRLEEEYNTTTYCARNERHIAYLPMLGEGFLLVFDHPPFYKTLVGLRHNFFIPF
jgi:hypothetical protein